MCLNAVVQEGVARPTARPTAALQGARQLAHQRATRTVHVIVRHAGDDGWLAVYRASVTAACCVYVIIWVGAHGRHWGACMGGCPWPPLGRVRTAAAGGSRRCF